MQGQIELVWPGGEHAFRLRIGELQALQDKCDAGPELILQRIRLGAWQVNDLFETLRFGLIGGGMDRDEARNLVRNVCDRTPWMDLKTPAVEVLAAALIGVPDDPAGESSLAGVTTQTATEETDAGSSATSTD